jgi:type II secretory ATPase GspE/PulE/Tfp pilus assembly ATPase PilB-like protein
VKKIFNEAEMASLKEAFPATLIKDHNAFYKGEGCNRCNHSGYKGRVGIHEVLEVDEKIRELIMKKANGDEVRKLAIENGMVTMSEDGFQKAVDGVTTIEEVLRVFHE